MGFFWIFIPKNWKLKKKEVSIFDLNYNLIDIIILMYTFSSIIELFAFSTSQGLSECQMTRLFS
jgi:hypothetical protein